MQPSITSDYKIVFHDGANLHFMFFNTHSSEDAIIRLYELFPTAHILEVHALKAQILENVIRIQNIIQVDFKARKRIA